LIVAGILAFVLTHTNRASHASTPKGLAGDERKAPALGEYAGSASCKDCHEEAFAGWQGSHHELAERKFDSQIDGAAFAPPRSFKHGSQTTESFLSNGVPFITALGLTKQMEAHPVLRVIGTDPLRQFLVTGSNGRVQAMEAVYDPRSNEWFNVYGSEDRQPGEWGHWTGRGMTWNYMCADCHNTALKRGYDPATDTYHTTMAEMTVGCEACHGPLKAHNEWQEQYGNSGKKDPTLPKLTRQQTLDTCGDCHARRGELTADWTAGEKFFNHRELVVVDHSESYYPDGQIREEDYEYGSFLGSRMHDGGVKCTDCHNPHTAKIRLPGNWLCMQCHNGSYTNAPVIQPVAHSHHKVFGFDTNGVAVNTDLLGYDPKKISETGGECVNCHMPQTLYMQRHWRHDHGFTIPDPLLTKQHNIPNACNRCHKDKDVDWSQKAVETWYGDKMQRPRRQRAQIFARARAGDAEAMPELVRWLTVETNAYWTASTVALLEPWSTRPEATPSLMKGLEHTNALVRAVAARALDPAAQANAAGAREALQKALKDPIRAVRVAAGFSLRASLSADSAEYRELMRYFDVNADEPAGQVQRGVFHFSRNEFPSALTHFEKAAAWDPGSAAVQQELAVVYSAMNRPQDAVSALQHACQLAPRDPESHYKLGLALNEIGDPKGTIRELKTVVELEPRHSGAWYNLGLAQSAAGDEDSALLSLGRAETVSPLDQRIPYARATILARLGRTQEARQAAGRVLELAPGNAEARQLWEMLGR
jgi:predicted CXXCH cytochrome family protein